MNFGGFPNAPRVIPVVRGGCVNINTNNNTKMHQPVAFRGQYSVYKNLSFASQAQHIHHANATQHHHVQDQDDVYLARLQTFAPMGQELAEPWAYPWERIYKPIRRAPPFQVTQHDEQEKYVNPYGITRPPPGLNFNDNNFLLPMVAKGLAYIDVDKIPTYLNQDAIKERYKMANKFGRFDQNWENEAFSTNNTILDRKMSEPCEDSQRDKTMEIILSAWTTGLQTYISENNKCFTRKPRPSDISALHSMCKSLLDIISEERKRNAVLSKNQIPQNKPTYIVREARNLVRILHGKELSNFLNDLRKRKTFFGNTTDFKANDTYLNITFPREYRDPCTHYLKRVQRVVETHSIKFIREYQKQRYLGALWEESRWNQTFCEGSPEERLKAWVYDNDFQYEGPPVADPDKDDPQLPACILVEPTLEECFEGGNLVYFKPNPIGE